jgi:branched-chain amino acid transport system permease protein
MTPARAAVTVSTWRPIAIGAVVVLLALFPLVGSGFYVELVAKVMILAIFALSLDLLVGYTGLVSFGHAAFFGIGAYTLGLLSPGSLRSRSGSSSCA